MMATHVYTFSYDPPIVDPKQGHKITSTTGEVEHPQGDQANWSAYDVEALARNVAATMQQLGDPGPYRWCLVEKASAESDHNRQPSRPRDFTLHLKGGGMFTNNVLLLRGDQVPSNPGTWKEV